MISENVIKQLRNNKLTNRWLKLGIISLGIAGIYSLILVILRTPLLSNVFLNPHIFKSALIIHVNLSILVWLLSITASIWCYNLKSNFLSNLFFKLAFIGMVFMAVSPIAESFPIMNNYIPILENIVFILGLTLFGVALLLCSVHVLYLFDWQNKNSLINTTILLSSIMFILTWLCFTLSYWQLQNIIEVISIDIDFYYELLFWSGGHLLQFIYTQIVIMIWILLLESLLGKELQLQKYYLILFWLNFIFGILNIGGHFYDIIDGEFKEYYTKIMKYFGGVATIFCIIGILWEFVTNRLFKQQNIEKASLLCSIILFLFGGAIALNISGINVAIPAHYHGSIVGISIACMGYCYCIVIAKPSKRAVAIFSNKLKKIAASKLKFLLAMTHHTTNNATTRNDKNFATVTIYILTFGQILHITGLALAGGYGVLRKTPGSEIAVSAKLYMGMMGGGGLIAIVGGLMFVFICGKTFFFKSDQNYDI